MIKLKPEVLKEIADFVEFSQEVGQDEESRRLYAGIEMLLKLHEQVHGGENGKPE